MADLSEVLTELASMIGIMIYPDGVDAVSAVGKDVRIYPGWPMSDQLDNDLRDGRVHISIFPLPEERNITTGLAPKEYSIGTGVDTGTTIKDIKRQEQIIMITEWANSPSSRDDVNKIIEPRLADIGRFTLPNGEQVMMRYRDSRTIDNLQKSAIYRKDLIFVVSYSTTLTTTDYVIKEIDINTTIQEITTIITVV